MKKLQHSGHGVTQDSLLLVVTRLMEAHAQQLLDLLAAMPVVKPGQAPLSGLSVVVPYLLQRGAEGGAGAVCKPKVEGC